MGSFLNTDIYPGHKEVLGLSVTGSGSVNSKSYFQFKYKVSENGLGNNVKISVYKSNNPIEITENHFNCVKKNEKVENSNDTKYFETCEEKDLGLLLEETALNGGQEDIVIGRDSITILKDNVDITKYYYVVVEFINQNSPQNEDMNRSLVGKVEVELIPSFENKFANNIETKVVSQNESWNQVETFSIHVTSEKYNIVSMSEDLESWEELASIGKDITIEKTVTSNGVYTNYFQDEAGNVSIATINATKVDRTKPTANLSISASNNIITINASSSRDNESGIKKYYYSLDGINFEESIENQYSMTDKGLTYGIATEAIKSIPTIEVFLKVEDNAGNISEIKKVTKARSGGNTSSIAYDGTADNNLRYIGADPNNYVSFNNELWRIIGVMNNIDDGTGKKETRMKIVRNESIGEYAWDNKNIYIGYGSNNWSDSTLQVVLNSGAYWNRTTGECPYAQNNQNISCNFTDTGLLINYKEMIGNVKWNLGATDMSTTNNQLVSEIYKAERLSSTYQGHSSTWIGKIGLMYPSDYGYATGGSNRSTCLTTSITSTTSINCANNNWINKTAQQWLLTPMLNHTFVYTIRNGYITKAYPSHCPTCSGCHLIFPTLYLKSNVKITGGLGTSSSPFQLELS